MYIHVYAYTHTYTHTYVYTHIHVYSCPRPDIGCLACIYIYIYQLCPQAPVQLLTTGPETHMIPGHPRHLPKLWDHRRKPRAASVSQDLNASSAERFAGLLFCGMLWGSSSYGLCGCSPWKFRTFKSRKRRLSAGAVRATISLCQGLWKRAYSSTSACSGGLKFLPVFVGSCAEMETRQVPQEGCCINACRRGAGKNPNGFSIAESGYPETGCIRAHGKHAGRTPPKPAFVELSPPKPRRESRGLHLHARVRLTKGLLFDLGGALGPLSKALYIIICELYSMCCLQPPYIHYHCPEKAYLDSPSKNKWRGRS